MTDCVEKVLSSAETDFLRAAGAVDVLRRGGRLDLSGFIQ
jgi:hypothetical protein